jgi:hypothetical protein
VVTAGGIHDELLDGGYCVSSVLVTEMRQGEKSVARPAFVTFTGIDDAALAKGMRELSRRYPIEWGVLVDRERNEVPLFPGAQQIDRFRKAGVRLCAHVCGDLAGEIAHGRVPTMNLAGFSRIQVNHGRSGADVAVVRAVSEFAALHGVRAVLQCTGEFPIEHTAVDWLFDISFGEGVRPDSFPTLRSDHPFCGFSGGIGPTNVQQVLGERVHFAGGHQFWIDMESGVRSAGAFDLGKCAAVCRAVYG